MLCTTEPHVYPWLRSHHHRWAVMTFPVLHCAFWQSVLTHTFHHIACIASRASWGSGERRNMLSLYQKKKCCKKWTDKTTNKNRSSKRSRCPLKTLATVMTQERWASSRVYTQLRSLCAGIVLPTQMFFLDKKICGINSDVCTAHQLCWFNSISTHTVMYSLTHTADSS